MAQRAHSTLDGHPEVKELHRFFLYTVVNQILCMQKKNFNSDLTVDWIHQNSLSHISYVRLDHTLHQIHFQENEISTTACDIHHSAHCALSC